jgi:hypothetical protein
VLFTVALLCVGLAACGGASHGTSASSRASDTTPATSTTEGPSGQPSRPPQNDDYISTYGHEATEPDRREITALVNRYYAAAVAEDGARACPMIYSSVALSLPKDYGNSSSPSYMHGKSCPAVLSNMFKHLPGQTTADLASTKVTGVRVRGNHGFAQFTSRSFPTGEIAVGKEGGTWKLMVVIGEACRNCSSRPQP